MLSHLKKAGLATCLIVALATQAVLPAYAATTYWGVFAVTFSIKKASAVSQSSKLYCGALLTMINGDDQSYSATYQGTVSGTTCSVSVPYQPPASFGAPLMSTMQVRVFTEEATVPNLDVEYDISVTPLTTGATTAISAIFRV